MNQVAPLESADGVSSGAAGEGGPLAQYDRFIYQYLPTMQYTDILNRLSKCAVPSYGSTLRFHACLSLNPVQYLRAVPSYDLAEHTANASTWALPTLLSWIPVDLLVWVLSLLMYDHLLALSLSYRWVCRCEAKVLVVGYEPGLVSCGVMGLTSLLRPLSWVAPFIPVLPIKHLDFIESPVPILAGLVLDPADHSCTAHSLLDRCQYAHLLHFLCTRVTCFVESLVGTWSPRCLMSPIAK